MLLGVALGGVEHQPAEAAPRETRPGRSPACGKAAQVQAAIDRMHARVEILVEDYNEVREALAQTRVEQARTHRQVLDARRRLRAARRLRRPGRAPGAPAVAAGRQAPPDRVPPGCRAGGQGPGRRRPGRRSLRAAGRAVAFARSQLGKPYVWGASGPSSYDRSGLVMAAYRRAGVWLPRVSRAQAGAGPRVDLGSLTPGDLVFFAYNTGNPGSIHHVGMYVGGGAMIEAPYSGASVRIASIGRRDDIGAVRPTG